MLRMSIFVAIIVTIWCSCAFPQPLFTPPVNLGPVINTSVVESDPFWDGPRKRLYFARDFKIWYAQWNGTNWDSPVPLGPQINSGPDGVQSPSVSPDGQRLHLVFDARQGYPWDIWVSNWDSSLNDWGTPVNAGYPVNTPEVEFSAHLVPDGRMFFSSCCYADSQYPFGRCGIYASEWNGSSWSIPLPQWECGNEPEYPSIPANGQWLYFDEPGGHISAVEWDGLAWVPPAYRLDQQLGGRTWTPSITPSGDSLFVGGWTPDLGGFGGSDIYLAKRLSKGDLNMDGQRTPADVALELYKVFLGWAYPAPEPYGDMNCDNQFTGADAALLLLVVYVGAAPEC